jgi:hypothetical protein
MIVAMHVMCRICLKFGKANVKMSTINNFFFVFFVYIPVF